eukprot:364636-Chlamydomonas_euryale.AAC.6
MCVASCRVALSLSPSLRRAFRVRLPAVRWRCGASVRMTRHDATHMTHGAWAAMPPASHTCSAPTQTPPPPGATHLSDQSSGSSPSATEQRDDSHSCERMGRLRTQESISRRMDATHLPRCEAVTRLGRQQEAHEEDASLVWTKTLVWRRASGAGQRPGGLVMISREQAPIWYVRVSCSLD